MERRFSSGELVKRIFDDVRDLDQRVPEQTMTPEEASDVILALDMVVSRCCEAMSAMKPVAVESFVYLMKEASRKATEAFSRRIAPGQHSPYIFQQLVEILQLCARDRQFGPSAALHALGLTTILCQMSGLKQSMCAQVLPLIVSIIDGTGSAGHGWREKRLSVGAILDLVRGSVQAKEAVQPYLGHLSGLLMSTDDFFLQLQCTELIWRIVRQKTELLDDPMFSLVPQHLKSAIRRLPNNQSLVPSLVDVMETHNGLQEPTTVFPLPLTFVSTASGEVCGETKVYFAKGGIVGLFPDTNGENFFLTYDMVRSVKLGRERKLALRLYVAPDALQNALDIEGGNDVLFLKLTTTAAQTLTHSPIQQWMTEGMANSRRSAPQQRPSTSDATPAELQSRTAFVEPPASEAPQPRRSMLEATLSDYGPSGRQNAPRPQSSNSNPFSFSSASSMGHVPPARAAGAIAERSANSLEREIGTRKRLREETDALHQHQQGDNNKNNSNAHQHNSVSRFSFSGGLSTGPAISNSNNQGSSSSSSFRQSFMPPQQEQQQQQQGHQQHEDAVANMVNALRHQVEEHVAKRQEANQALINKALLDIQHRIDFVREQNRRERDEFEASFRQELQTLQQKEQKLRETGSLRVSQLNVGLQEMQAIGTHVTDQITEIEQILQQTMDAAYEKELSALRDIRRNVEEDLQGMEQTMHGVIANADPQAMIAGIMREQQMQQAGGGR